MLKLYNIKNILLPIVLLCCVHLCAYGEPDWKLKKDENGIKVFTASSDSSKFKSVKVVCTVKAKMPQLVAFLLDVSKQEDWVYNAKSTRLLKKVGDNEIVFYSEVSLPWPCENRDYIAHLTFNEQSPQLVTIDSRSQPDLLPAKEGKIRVRSSVAHWDLSPVNNNTVQIVYTVQFDPSGEVPPWLVNMFLTKGPYETFEHLREQVNDPAYQNAQVAFLKK